MKYRRLLFLLFCFIAVNAHAKQPGDTLKISENLLIVPLSNKSFIHISYVTYPSFGRVACNGMVYINQNKAVVMDTPPNNEISRELINWIEEEFQGVSIDAVVINHFHSDCLGGLEVFHEAGVTSYASALTRKLAEQDNAILPQKTFKKQKKLKIGDVRLECRYLGEGHTRDNIVCWIPDEKVLFGGCMVKSVNASKGNLADANIEAWPHTVAQIKKEYANATTVVPGHGSAGGTELLDYTIQLFTP